MILTLIIVVLPKMLEWKKNSEKFSPNFLCFAISICLFEPNCIMEQNVENKYKYVLCLGQILHKLLNYKNPNSTT